MTVYFNNEPVSLKIGTLEELIIEQGLLNAKGIAVALNQQVIPKIDWGNINVKEGDRVLVITATQGG